MDFGGWWTPVLRQSGLRVFEVLLLVMGLGACEAGRDARMVLDFKTLQSQALFDDVVLDTLEVDVLGPRGDSITLVLNPTEPTFEAELPAGLGTRFVVRGDRVGGPNDRGEVTVPVYRGEAQGDLVAGETLVLSIPTYAVGLWNGTVSVRPGTVIPQDFAVSLTTAAPAEGQPGVTAVPASTTLRAIVIEGNYTLSGSFDADNDTHAVARMTSLSVVVGEITDQDVALVVAGEECRAYQPAAVRAANNCQPLGITLTGLAGDRLVVQNGTSSLELTNNGTFEFADQFKVGETYNLEFAVQPANPTQACVVINQTPSGTIPDGGVTEAVNCTTTPFTVGGSVEGLNFTPTDLVLTETGSSQSVSPASATSFSFPGGILSGTPFNVTISAQPTGAQCLIAPGSEGGTVTNSDVNTVRVICTESVKPLFGPPSLWNRYMIDDDPGGDRLLASGDACPASGPLGAERCFHAGAYLSVTLYNAATPGCAGVTATDDRGWFTWVCRDLGNDLQIVSTGLDPSTRLLDFLDTSGPNWHTNQLRIAQGGLTRTSPSTAWWTNPVVSPSSGVVRPAANEVHLVTQSNANVNFSVNTDGVAVVFDSGAGLSTTTIPPILVDDSTSDNRVNHLWLEGGSINGNSTPASFAGVAYSVVLDTAFTNTPFNVGGGVLGLGRNRLENIVSNGATSGLVVGASPENDFENVSILGFGSEGVRVDNGADGNRFRGLRVEGTGSGQGVSVNGSVGVVLQQVVVARVGGAGLTLDNANGSQLFDVTVHNTTGVRILNSENVVWVGGTLFSNSASGLSAQVRSSVLANLLIANGPIEITSIPLQGEFNTLINVVAVNGHRGYGLGDATNPLTNSRLHSIAAVSWNPDPAFQGSSFSNLEFSGNLVVGNNTIDCSFTNPGNTPGIGSSGGACVLQDASTASLVENVDVSNTFVGKVADSDNSSDDAQGRASGSAITDWTEFENAQFRGWLTDNADASFPDPSQHGACGGQTCQIFDWRLQSSDSVFQDQAVPARLSHAWTTPTVDAATCNSFFPGSVVATLYSADRCVTEFTTFAFEVPDLAPTGSGNGNGLCEDGEPCLLAPHLGSYQGEGNILSSGSATDNGVTFDLYQFENRTAN